MVNARRDDGLVCAVFAALRGGANFTGTLQPAATRLPYSALVMAFSPVSPWLIKWPAYAGAMAVALAGSLGSAPTGNIDPERRYPSMFEPIQGSASDIMGNGLANPALHTRDLGGKATTAQVTQAVRVLLGASA